MSSPRPLIIDTHAHLADKSFTNDRSSVLISSRSIGVVGVIAVSETLSEAKSNLKLADIHNGILAAAGLYPCIIDREQAEQMGTLIERKSSQIVSIGEVGLDHWIIKDEEEREIQRTIFELFIDLSLGLDLPLNVHSRSAGRHALDLLLSKNAEYVQMHAFDGKASTAMKGVEAGYYFSIPPSIVRSRQKQKLVKQLPMSCILLETDSPVLGPDSEARNEPANISVAAEAIAEIKEISVEQVYEETFENTQKLYGHTKAFQRFLAEEVIVQ